MRTARHILTITAAASIALVGWASGCGGSGTTSGFGNGPGNGNGNPNGGGDGGSILGNNPDGGPSFGNQMDGGGPSGMCVGLQCQVHACGGGGSTTISGVVYDPAGNNPLYDVVVYVPNSPPQPFKSGASCDTCADLYTGNPVATALTDAAGKFQITGAPDGANIPLVIQIGKWRKQITLPSVKQCQDNPQPDKSLKLPKNHSEGDIPMIAISTGGADSLECLLSRIGVDQSEYVPGGGASQNHIQIYQGGISIFGMGAPNTSPPGPASSASLWASQADLMKYDMVLLSCEGSETLSMNQQALFDYAKGGGRVFASHFHYAWFNTGPFGSANLATWSPGTNNMGDINANIVTTLPNNQPFPKGQALKQWLGNVSALTAGELPIKVARHNADVSAANTPSQAWIVADNNAKPAGATEYFSFNTPLGTPEANQCGRVVFSDLHVGAASGDYANGSMTVPTGCANNGLSPQEKALEFMLFDLSSCVTPNGQPPVPPPPTPK